LEFLTDPWIKLEAELKTIHPQLIATPDSEVNSQVQKLLQKMKVHQLLPEHVINNHIIPILKSEDWKVGLLFLDYTSNSI